jgi:hypothetical protein
MCTEIKISKTGRARGFGTMPYKWVSYLTPEEREIVRQGGIVLVTGCPPSGGGNGTGTTLRRVHYRSGRYYHRVPDDSILSTLPSLGGA